MNETEAEYKARYRAALVANGVFAGPDDARCSEIIVLFAYGAARCERIAGHSGHCDTVAFDWDLAP